MRRFLLTGLVGVLAGCSLLMSFDPTGLPCSGGACLEGYRCIEGVCQPQTCEADKDCQGFEACIDSKCVVKSGLSDAGFDAGNPPPDAGCIPTTCQAKGKNCGTLDDGCGGTLGCGTCLAPNTCAGSGVANVCGCTGETTAQLCSGKCGALVVTDKCSVQRSLNCGGCTLPATCGGVQPNVCGVFIPQGRKLGTNAQDWTYTCADTNPTCTTTFINEAGGVEGNAVRVDTTAAFAFAAITPATKNLGAPLSSYTKLGFYMKAQNTTNGGWQGNFPTVVLYQGTSFVKLTPTSNLLPRTPDRWIFFEVPLAGGASWTRTSTGTVSVIDWVEIQADTYDSGFILWIDSLTLY